MINNFEDLFLKYKSKLSVKKNTEDIFIDIIKKEIGIEIKRENIKLNQKEKQITVSNLASSYKFIIKNKFLEKDLENKIKNQIDYKVIFN